MILQNKVINFFLILWIFGIFFLGYGFYVKNDIIIDLAALCLVPASIWSGFVVGDSIYDYLCQKK